MEYARTSAGELLPITRAELPGPDRDIDGRRMFSILVRHPTIADVEQAALWARRRRRYSRRLRVSVERARRSPAPECVPSRLSR